jgi:pimeloyl-ACP methyl ester carboxylesterase
VPFASRRFPAPGRLIDAGGCRLHVQTAGKGSPPVIFDAALAGSSLSWTLVQPEIAKLTLTAAYDRAGMGWSGDSPAPRSLVNCAGELRALLEKARIPAPRVLVGHSYGALTAQLYAARHPGEVAALVLIDPPDPLEWTTPDARRRLEIGARLCRRGAVAAKLGIASMVAALASTGALGFARRIARIWSGGTLQGQENQILAPMNKVPAALHPVLRRIWTQPKFWRALGGQMEQLADSCAGLAAERLPADLPLAVLSASRISEAQLTHHQALAAQSTRGRHLRAQDAGHWIPLDEPELVIAAIRDILVAESLRPGVSTSG